MSIVPFLTLLVLFVLFGIAMGMESRKREQDDRARDEALRDWIGKELNIAFAGHLNDVRKLIALGSPECALQDVREAGTPAALEELERHAEQAESTLASIEHRINDLDEKVNALDLRDDGSGAALDDRLESTASQLEALNATLQLVESDLTVLLRTTREPRF